MPIIPVGLGTDVRKPVIPGHVEADRLIGLGGKDNQGQEEKWDRREPHEMSPFRFRTIHHQATDQHTRTLTSRKPYGVSL